MSLNPSPQSVRSASDLAPFGPSSQLRTVLNISGVIWYSSQRRLISSGLSSGMLASFRCCFSTSSAVGCEAFFFAAASLPAASFCWRSALRLSSLTRMAIRTKRPSAPSGIHLSVSINALSDDSSSAFHIFLLPPQRPPAFLMTAMSLNSDFPKYGGPDAMYARPPSILKWAGRALYVAVRNWSQRIARWRQNCRGSLAVQWFVVVLASG